MSFAYEMASPSSLQNLKDRAQQSPITELSSYSWTYNYLATPFTGLAASVVDVGMLAADVTTPFLKEYAKSTDKAIDYFSDLPSGSTKTSQDFVDSVRDSTHAASRWLAPDPRTTNFAGQAIHGFFEVAPQFIAGSLLGGPVGGAALSGGLMANKSFQLSKDAGVDPLTAAGVGAIEGVTTGVGALLPATVGTSLTSGLSTASKIGINALFGSTSQAAVGIGSRQSISYLLQESGYEEMASQYRPFDRNALYADLVLGGLFGGGFSYLESKYPRIITAQNKEILKKEFDKFVDGLTSRDADLASYVNNVNHIEIGTLPGIPEDISSRTAHFDSMNKALAQILGDERVSVDEMVDSLKFIENPDSAQVRSDINNSIKEYYNDVPIFKEPVLDEKIGGINKNIQEQSALPNPERAVENDFNVQDKDQSSTISIDDKKAQQNIEQQNIEQQNTREVDLAHTIAKENPDMVVVSETGELMKVSDLLLKNDMEIKTATRESMAYRAAVSCLLSG